MKVKKLRKFLRNLIQDLTVLIAFITVIIELIQHLGK